MDSVKDKFGKAQNTVDEGFEKAAAHTKQGLASATAAFSDLYSRGEQYWETAKAHASSTLSQADELQDQAFGVLKDGIEYCILHPYISYPAAGTAALVALPGVRRFVYRVTLGRLRNPEAIVSSSETKLSTLAAKTQEFGAESKKLQARNAHLRQPSPNLAKPASSSSSEERAQLAHQEWTRGHQKLKAARQELQRLEASVGKSERLAQNVLADLRSLRQARATELRSEAALKLSQLRQQRAALQKEIRWIVKQDV
eukprot:gene13596-13721_t